MSQEIRAMLHFSVIADSIVYLIDQGFTRVHRNHNALEVSGIADVRKYSHTHSHRLENTVGGIVRISKIVILNQHRRIIAVRG